MSSHLNCKNSQSFPYYEINTICCHGSPLAWSQTLPGAPNSYNHLSRDFRQCRVQSSSPDSATLCCKIVRRFLTSLDFPLPHRYHDNNNTYVEEAVVRNDMRWCLKDTQDSVQHRQELNMFSNMFEWCRFYQHYFKSQCSNSYCSLEYLVLWRG